MPATTFLDLAASRHVVPIGTHLVLHRQPDPETVLLDGERLGQVIVDTARQFATPLAIPLMDLRLEKDALLASHDIPVAQRDTFHFDCPPVSRGPAPLTPRQQATLAALRRVAEEPDLMPLGMCIGPFSLTTKLLTDPITPVYLAGTGLDRDEDDDVALLEACLDLSQAIVTQYIQAQIEAGAKGIIVCEPAANLVYFSPNQLQSSYQIFDRYVIEGLRVVSDLLARHQVSFILHDCGELTEGMVRRFGDLHPAMLSLGASRQLWDDARLLPPQVVLYGNLPSKRFVASDLPVAAVETAARTLRHHMDAAGHPCIVGSECDILSVPGSEAVIAEKVEAMLRGARS